MSDQGLEYGLTPPTELFELAASLRNVIERMLVIDRAHEDLRTARGQIDEIAGRLAALGRTGLEVRMFAETEPGPGDMRPYYAGDARRWHYNPVFPPMALAFGDDGILRGTVTLGLAYEGPPGCVHGGVLSMLLDQLLGQANLAHGIPAMTGSLTVRYRRPTPLRVELDLEVHPPEQVHRRKHVTRGWIRANGEVTAEAEGVFVLPDFDKRGEMLPHLRGSEARRMRDGKPRP
jgi:hypothetical protein